MGSVPRNNVTVEVQKKNSVNTSEKGEKETNVEREGQEVSVEKLKVAPKNRVSYEQ